MTHGAQLQFLRHIGPSGFKEVGPIFSNICEKYCELSDIKWTPYSWDPTQPKRTVTLLKISLNYWNEPGILVMLVTTYYMVGPHRARSAQLGPFPDKNKSSNKIEIEFLPC